MDCGKIKLNSFSEAFGKLWEPDPLIVVVGATRSLPFAKNLAVCIPFLCVCFVLLCIYLLYIILFIFTCILSKKNCSAFNLNMATVIILTKDVLCLFCFLLFCFVFALKQYNKMKMHEMKHKTAW